MRNSHQWDCRGSPTNTKIPHLRKHKPKTAIVGSAVVGSAVVGSTVVKTCTQIFSGPKKRASQGLTVSPFSYHIKIVHILYKFSAVQCLKHCVLPRCHLCTAVKSGQKMDNPFVMGKAILQAAWAPGQPLLIAWLPKLPVPSSCLPVKYQPFHIAPSYRSIGCWHMGLTDTHYYESISLARRPEAFFTKGIIT